MKQKIVCLIVASSCCTLLCFAVSGVNAQKPRTQGTRRVVRKPPAPQPVPTPVAIPSPSVPTPPATPCPWCEPILNVLEKGARWQTIIEILDEATPSEVAKASGGKPIAALVVSGEDLKGELTIDRATGVGGPVEIFLALNNQDINNAMTVGDNSGSWQAWTEHVAYRIELKKLHAFIAFFDREEFRSGRTLKAMLTIRLDADTIRQLGKAWKKPPK